MDVNKKSRAELKRFFVKNALPTESNFADLIDAALNQKDDGLAKPAGEALSVEAAGTAKAALRVYESFADPNAAWTLGVQDNTAANVPKGFTLSDRAGMTRLFVNAADGTLNAGALTVSGAVRTGALTTNGALAASAGLTVTGGNAVVGAEGTPRTLTVWGTLNAFGALNFLTNQTLSVSGLLTASAGLNVTGAVLNANAGLTVTGAVLNANNGLTVRGAAVNIGTSTENPPSLTVWGAVSANNGLTVTGAAVNIGTSAANPQRLNVWGTLTANGGVTITGGLTVDSLNATSAAGISFPALTVTGALKANGGLTVTGGLTVDSISTSSGTGLSFPNLTVTGALNANAGLNVVGGGILLGNAGSPQGMFVSGSISANGGITVSGAPVNANAGLNVSGTLTANNRLTATGPVNLTPPPRNGVRLDRNLNQYLSVPATTISFSSGFTVQAWVYITAYGYSVPTRLMEFSVGSQGSDYIGFGFDKDGYLFGFVSKGFTVGTPVQLTASTAPSSRLPLGTWTHVAFSVDQTGSAKLYIKGSLWLNYPADPTLIPNNVSRNTNYFGRYADIYFNGFLAEVSLWNVALASITTASPAGNETGLVGYWKMNETAGTVAVNSCVNTPALGNATLSTQGGSLPTFSSAFDRVQQTTISQEEWFAPTLLNNWIPHAPTLNQPGFFRDSLGIVHLRGMLKQSTSQTFQDGGNNSTIFALPIGYRPQLREVLATISQNAIGRIDITPDGQVIAIVGTSVWMSLDGITFRAIQ